MLAKWTYPFFTAVPDFNKSRSGLPVRVRPLFFAGFIMAPLGTALAGRGISAAAACRQEIGPQHGGRSRRGRGRPGPLSAASFARYFLISAGSIFRCPWCVSLRPADCFLIVKRRGLSANAQAGPSLGLDLSGCAS